MKLWENNFSLFKKRALYHSCHKCICSFKFSLHEKWDIIQNNYTHTRVKATVALVKHLVHISTQQHVCVGEVIRSLFRERITYVKATLSATHFCIPKSICIPRFHQNACIMPYHSKSKHVKFEICGMPVQTKDESIAITLVTSHKNNLKLSIQRKKIAYEQNYFN
jgi:hypothetical protein